ncbi:hypothetical protein D3C80_2035260 [compost metagenome]
MRMKKILSCKIPPMEPAQILCVSQQMVLLNMHRRSAMPLRRNSAKVLRVVPSRVSSCTG